MDVRNILPGETHSQSINRAIHESEFFLAILSKNSIDKGGNAQREVKKALEVWESKAENDIYLIPIRLEPCELPENLSSFYPANLFEPDGLQNLLKSLHMGVKHKFAIEDS